MAEKSWAGFSEEELNRIRLKEDSNTEGDKQLKTTALKQGRHKRKPQNRNQILKHNLSKQPAEANLNTLTASNEEISKNPNGLVQLRIDESGHVLEVVENISAKNNPSIETAEENLDEKLESNTNSFNTNNTGNKQIEFSLVNEKINSEKMANLEKFELRQKQMEEQNKQRRALLTQAIIDRQKKTQAENEKLLYIQKEMIKLDNLVSGDVAILRNHIEQASMEFNEAQKRYKKAEEEFVQAKIELFRRLDRKEQLTEHLCTIIEQNELRKAQMLIRLMKELEMDILTEEEGPGEKNTPILPQLCCLSDSLGGCSTLKSPPHTPLRSSETNNDCYDHNKTIPVEVETKNRVEISSTEIKTNQEDKSNESKGENGSSSITDDFQLSSNLSSMLNTDNH